MEKQTDASFVFPENMVTFIIKAVGIKGVSDDVEVNDHPGEVLCTVFMVRVSQDGSAHIAGPAVPE